MPASCVLSSVFVLLLVAIIITTLFFFARNASTDSSEQFVDSQLTPPSVQNAHDQIIDQGVVPGNVQEGLRVKFGLWRRPDYTTGYRVDTSKAPAGGKPLYMLSTKGGEHDNKYGLHVNGGGAMRLYAKEGKSISFALRNSDSKFEDGFDDSVVINNEALHARNLRVYKDVFININDNQNLYINGKKVIIDPTGVLKIAA